MRDLIHVLYVGSGLSYVPSPWIAMLTLFAVLGMLVYLITRPIVVLRQSFSMRGVLMSVAVTLWVIAYGVTVLAAILLSMHIGVANALSADTLFLSYLAFLFLSANVPLWYLLWRHGWFTTNAT